MKIYYAHSLHLYNSAQEGRDIRTLTLLGFDVVNPSDRIHVDKCKEIRAQYENYDEGSVKIMEYFMTVVDSCDAVGFRAHIDGKIPSGVGQEVLRALKDGKPIIELPSLINSKFLEKGETRQYLELNGQR